MAASRSTRRATPSSSPSRLRRGRSRRPGADGRPRLRARAGADRAAHGEPLVTDEGYVGDDVHCAARIAAPGHGGQVVLSADHAELVDGDGLTDLGEHRLKDIAEAVAIYQLGDGAFPPLKTISNTNLPRPASSFVGRERELAEVLGRMRAGARLVTLTGPAARGRRAWRSRRRRGSSARTRQASSGSGSPRSAIPRSSPRRSRRRSAPRTASPSTWG